MDIQLDHVVDKQSAGDSPENGTVQVFSPIVVWVGVDAPLHATTYHCVQRSELLVEDLSNPRVLLVVKSERASNETGLAHRLSEGTQGFLFRPKILKVSTPLNQVDLDRIDATVHQVMSTRYAALARRNIELSRELFEVRRVHEDLQAAFEQVETFLHASGLSEPRLLLELQPVEHEASFTTLPLSCDTPLQLNLPYEAHKIAGFSVHISRRSTLEGSSARLLVTMTSSNGAQTFGTWLTPLERLPESGWFSFLLDRLPTDYGHSVSLSFQLDQPADVSLTLTQRPLIGAAVLLQPDGGDPQGVMQGLPAIRLWSGLPGVRMTHKLDLQPFDFQCYDSTPLTRRVFFRLDPESAEQVHADGNAPGPLVSVDTSEQSVQVHPVARGLVVARIRQAMPSTYRELRAVVGVCHPEGPDVEFSMCVAGSPKQALERFLRNSQTPWVAASASHHAELSVGPQQHGGGNEEQHLYLATRLPPSGTTKYAWARFRNLHVVL